MRVTRGTGRLLAVGLRADRELPAERLDVFGLIRGLEVQLLRGPDKGSPLHGYYRRRDGRPFIFVNSADSLRRQRLTAAHELGHHFLNDDDDVTIVDLAEPDDRDEEREAYAFARELLMPRRAVQEVGSERTIEDAVEAIVKRFDVSPQVATVRLGELGLVSEGSKVAFQASLKSSLWKRYLASDDRRDQIDLDPRFKRSAKDLHNRGILSDARYEELVDRGTPADYHVTAS